MTSAVPDILARIVAQKQAELQGRVHLQAEFERLAEERRDHRPFRAALTRSKPAIIAEIKKASPSKGLLSNNFDPPAIARQYELGGAGCLSVLTDEFFFQGSLDDLRSARSATKLPVIRKDFTIDPFHVAEAAAHGADAILLIVAILTERQIRDCREEAAKYGMSALVEVHDAHELQIALAAGAEIIGVNNRDLRTFDVRLETSIRLAEQIPSGVTKVSESGIHSAEDVRRLMEAGYNAFLVGEHLMKSGSPEQSLRALLSASGVS